MAELNPPKGEPRLRDYNYCGVCGRKYIVKWARHFNEYHNGLPQQWIKEGEQPSDPNYWQKRDLDANQRRDKKRLNRLRYGLSGAQSEWAGGAQGNLLDDTMNDGVSDHDFEDF